MTVAQLKELLQERDLTIGGNKAELVDRLEEDDIQLAKFKARLGHVEQVVDDEEDGDDGDDDILGDLDLEDDDGENELDGVEDDPEIEDSEEEIQEPVEVTEEISEDDFEEFEEDDFEEVSDEEKVAIASVKEDAYCTPKLKSIVRRVATACGLIGASGRGCQPMQAKQIGYMAYLEDCTWGHSFNGLQELSPKTQITLGNG